MTTIFSGGLNLCLPPTVSVEMGGSLTTSGTIYLGIQGLNEAGVNFCSSLVAANYSAGNQIRVQFNSENRTDGILFPYYLLIASLDNNKANGYVIGLWKNWENDGRTLAAMTDIVLSLDSHLVIPPSSVANPSALPANSIQGQVRTVASLGSFYMRLDTTEGIDGDRVIEDGNGNKWVQHLGSTNYGAFPIGGTTGTFGCHQSAANIDAEILAANPLFPRPEYTPDGSSSLFDPNQPPIRLGFLNLYESEMAIGRRLRLNCFLNSSEPVSNLLSGRIFAKVLGFVNLETGELITENDTGDGNDQEGIGEWVAVESKLGFFVLQRPLPYNWAIAVEIAIGFKASELQIAPGSVLSFTLSCGVQSGVLVEGGSLYRQPQGGLIYDDSNYTGRVVPSIGGVKVERMTGGLIHGTQKRVYEFLETSEQFVSGLIPNTANQKITLSRDGIATFRGTDPIQSTEALLAIVSTQSGESDVFWSTTELTLSSQGISATLTYPTTTIEGKTASFNIPFIRVYLSINGAIYRQDNPLAVTIGLGSQVVGFSSVAGFTSISVEPDNFILGLFNAPGIALSATSGSLSGVVRIGVAYVYNGTVSSSINQSVLSGCIPVLSFGSTVDVNAVAQKWALILG